MATETSRLQERIDSGKSLVIAEVAPPANGDPVGVLDMARRYAGKVHALGISDNRDHVCMSALAAASLAASQGVEPILHVVTRDRNRIALVSDCLGAMALGIRNVLCTSGTHQTLGRFTAAKNVFDVDSTQLLQTYAMLGEDASLVGEEGGLDVNGSLCLGATAAPYADPLELQTMRLAKKVEAGARFLITQPVFDVERFETWWKEVTKRGIHEKAAVVAGIRILGDSQSAVQYAQQRPLPMVPDAVLQRMAAKSDNSAQRTEGIAIAVETVKRLSSIEGLRGFEICGAGDDSAALEVIGAALEVIGAALEVIDQSAPGTD